jgi:diacylglycerol kinase family enzyme
VLRARKTRAIDIGLLEYRRAEGGVGRSAFVNIASLGMAGLVDRYANASSKALGGQVSFLVATLRAFVRYRNARVRLVFDGDEGGASELAVVNVAVANGRYFGGGMHVAPGARLDDGLFDVVSIGDLNPVRATLSLPKLYRGTHLDIPGITVRRAARVEAQPISREDVLLDVDGEQLGILPATFTLLPRALPLVVPDGT